MSDSTSETVKKAIIKQVLIESQSANARTLMEVRTSLSLSLSVFSLLLSLLLPISHPPLQSSHTYISYTPFHSLPTEASFPPQKYAIQPPTNRASNVKKKTENRRKLLYLVRPQARLLPLQQREDVRDPVHRKVHGGVERGQHDLSAEDTAGDGQPVEE